MNNEMLVRMTLKYFETREATRKSKEKLEALQRMERMERMMRSAGNDNHAC